MEHGAGALLFFLYWWCPGCSQALELETACLNLCKGWFAAQLRDPNLETQPSHDEDSAEPQWMLGAGVPTRG